MPQLTAIRPSRSNKIAARVAAAALAATLAGGIAASPAATTAALAAPTGSSLTGTAPRGNLLPESSATGSVQLPGSYDPVPHNGAPQPQAFPASEYGWYLSDLSSHPYGNYVTLIDGFNDLRAKHPGVMKSNLDQVAEINNNAPAARIAQAQEDAATSKEGVLRIFADAFGEELGEHFRQALKEHRLPKTQMLFGGATARAGGVASSTFIEKQYYNFDRPFVVAPERITKHNLPGEDFYKTSKSFPSGHTNQSTWTTTLLSYMLPEFAPQLLARGAEGGYSRVVLGVHYPLDVIGGRMVGTAAAADRLNDPRMRANLDAAAQEIRAELEWRCGDALANCAQKQAEAGKGYNPESVDRYTELMNYGFTPVYSESAPMVVPQAAPALLLGKYPNLSYAQRAEILRQTAGAAGYPLDKQGPEGSWQRLNLAKALTAEVTIAADGSVEVAG